MYARVNFSVGLKVRSITAPVTMFFSFVRTNAAPLPGLTCRKDTTVQMPLSHSKVTPFLKSLALIMGKVPPQIV